MGKLHRPFEFLKLIRDGLVTRLYDIHYEGFHSGDYHFFHSLLEGLQKNWLHKCHRYL